MVKSIYKTYRILAFHRGLDAKSGEWIVSVKNEKELEYQIKGLQLAGFETVVAYLLDIRRHL